MLYPYLLNEDGDRILLDDGQSELTQEDDEIILTESGATLIMEENLAFIRIEGNVTAINGVADAYGDATGTLRIRLLGVITGEAIGVGSATGDIVVVRDV